MKIGPQSALGKELSSKITQSDLIKLVELPRRQTSSIDNNSRRHSLNSETTMKGKRFLGSCG